METPPERVMHLDTTYLTKRTLGQTSDSETSAASSSQVPSAEFLNLLDQVQQMPEVRQAALQRATARLATGYYLTRAAAEQTADAIQQTQD
jgi:hypothetical protein